MTTFIAISGPQNSGKTTLCYQLAARLKQDGVHVGLNPEAARSSFYLISGIRSVEMHLEVMSIHVAQEMRAAMEYDVVISDRSVIDFLAFFEARFSRLQGRERNMRDAIYSFAKHYAKIYSHIFYSTAVVGISPRDKMKAAETVSGEVFSAAFRKVASRLGVATTDLPSSGDRLQFVMDSVGFGRAGG